MTRAASMTMIGPLCAPLREFCTRCAPHSGPSRAERGKRYWRPAKGLRGNIKGLSLLAGFLLLAPMAFAQSVDGDWTTGLRAREPDRRLITLTLKADGSRLTGTIHGIRPIPVEGSIEGTVLKLTLKVATASGNELLLDYVAILEGDELKFTYQSETGRPPVFGPAAREFTAKRK